MKLLTKWGDLLEDVLDLDSPGEKAFGTVVLLGLGIPLVSIATILLVIAWPIALCLAGCVIGWFLLRHLFRRIDNEG